MLPSTTRQEAMGKVLASPANNQGAEPYSSGPHTTPRTTTIMIRLPEAADTAHETGYEKRKMIISTDFYKNISISNMRINCLLN